MWSTIHLRTMAGKELAGICGLQLHCSGESTFTAPRRDENPGLSNRALKGCLAKTSLKLSWKWINLLPTSKRSV